MNDETGIALEYERLLMGKQKIFSRAYNREGVSEEKIIPIFKYVFIKLLRWDAGTMKSYLNHDILSLLKLSKLATRLNIPQEINIEKDCFYLACKVYPEQIQFSKRNLVLYTYEKVLNKERAKFPRNFFEAKQGHINACICLQYSLSKKTFRNARELYEFFSDGKAIRKYLKEIHLYDYFIALYEFPVDFLHACLSDHDKSELFYHRIRLNDEIEYQKQGGDNFENHSKG